MRASILFCVVCVACNKASPNRPDATTTPIATRAHSGADARELHALADAVRAAAGAGDTSERGIATALDALATVLAPMHAREVEALRDATSTLRGPDASSDQRANVVHDALVAARSALERSTTTRRRTAHIRALNQLDRAIASLDTDRPLIDQTHVVQFALEGATGAAFARAGLRPPFPLARDAPEAIDLPDALDRLRSDTLAPARASWGEARMPSAKLLSDLAAVLGGVAAEELQFYAARLERLGDTGFGQARLMREGLTAAIDGVAGGPHDERAVADARAAIANIDIAEGVAFQRATIQDAARATVSAVLVSR